MAKAAPSTPSRRVTDRRVTTRNQSSGQTIE